MSDQQEPKKRGPKPWRTEEEKRLAANARRAKYVANNLERCRAESREASKRRKAAKARAEGRVPGRVGNQKRQSPEERKVYLAEWRARNADKIRAQDAALRRNKRHAMAAFEGRTIKIGAPVRFTPEERKERARLCSLGYRDRHPEQSAISDASYYENNKASVIKRTAANHKRFVEENPEESRARRRRYYEKGIDGSRNRCRNRRARKNNAEGSHTKEDIDLLLSLQRGHCVICLKPLLKGKFDVDHYMPLVLGGSNDRKNLHLLHKRCNTSKGARHPADHAKTLGLLCW